MHNIIHQYPDNIEGVQWYFGTRNVSFYLFGIDKLKEKLKDYDFIEIGGYKEGELVPSGEPAITITIRDKEKLSVGNEIEDLVYNEIWYRSTVGSLLMNCKTHLEINGFTVRTVYPQLGRSSINPEQTKMALELWETIFYPLPTKPRPVAFHNDILINGEDFCLENYQCVMADTWDIDNFIAKVKRKNYTHTVMVDSNPLMENMLKILSETECHVCQVESISLHEWKSLVSQFTHNPRVWFTIGSFVFSKVNRDTLNFIYKTCAVKRNNTWVGVGKTTPNKETLKGYFQ